MLLPTWLMLLPCFWLADVIAMWLMLLSLIVFTYLADVIAWWLELLPLLCSDVLWQMLLPGGWWNCLLWLWVADGVAAMGSPISPIVANLFTEDLEVNAIRTSPTPATLWKRFVDDTFTIIKKEDRNSFLQHLNSIHQHIKFTCEEVRDDGSMPFLSTSVFRKPTHTDLYLQWDSHHTICSKYSVAGTLYHRAKMICSDPQLQKKEEDHLCQALQKCRYPIWAINRAKIKSQNPQEAKTEIVTIKLARRQPAARTYIWWFHTNKG